MSLLSVEHLTAVVLVAVLAVALTIAARAWPGRWITMLCRLLAVMLLLTEPAYWMEQVIRNAWSAQTDLPFQLSDAAVFVGAAALWWRTRLLVELTYFWGFGAVLQALVTPDLAEHFPDLRFVLFYLSHGAVVIAALLLTVGMRLAPTPRAVWRVFGITLGYTIAVGLIDVATGSNYMYLRAKPIGGSLLKFMGPWPWYVASGMLLALVMLVILDAPFWIARRREASSLCFAPTRRSGTGGE
jgi:hypothetical integral membrane protein (TIGR02206 family)